jgi:hypothetical protein
MRRATLTILLSLWFPILALGQASQESWDNLKELRPGQEIQVVDPHMKTLNGAFVSSSHDALTLRVGNDEVSVPRPDVTRVSVRHTSKRLRNTLIGMGIGAAGGLGAGFKLMERETGYAGAVVGTAAFFAAVGAGVGAVIPARTRTIYRASQGPAQARR